MSGRYIVYPKAMKLLAERLGATPEELAAWVRMGRKKGGLAAYLNANELDPPPRFFFDIGSGDDFDYLAPLMACWFQEDDIVRFDPTDRYVTGKALIERWSAHPGVQPEAFIRAKIAESRLSEFHPITGGTEGIHPQDGPWPPLSSALFVRAHVEKIEAEDFGVIAADKDGPHSELSEVVRQESTDQAKSENPCAVFQAMKDLDASEMTLVFVGDTSDSGLGANN